MKMLIRKFSVSLRLGGLILLLSLAIVAQVPSPQSVLGFHPTDDKTIADWSQITNYFSRLDIASNRVAVREIGKTTLGKPLIVAFISSPENIKNLERYRQISAKLADPRTDKGRRRARESDQKRKDDRLDLVLDTLE